MARRELIIDSGEFIHGGIAYYKELQKVYNAKKATLADSLSWYYI